MIKKLHNCRGFASMMEVIITSMVFSVAAFSIFSALSSVRPSAITSTSQLKAAYEAHGIMAELRTAVNAQIWDNSGFPLSTGETFTRTVGDQNISYCLIAGPDGTRQLQMTVDYPESSL